MAIRASNITLLELRDDSQKSPSATRRLAQGEPLLTANMIEIQHPRIRLAAIYARTVLPHSGQKLDNSAGAAFTISGFPRATGKSVRMWHKKFGRRGWI